MSVSILDLITKQDRDKRVALSRQGKNSARRTRRNVVDVRESTASEVDVPPSIHYSSSVPLAAKRVVDYEPACASGTSRKELSSVRRARGVSPARMSGPKSGGLATKHSADHNAAREGEDATQDDPSTYGRANAGTASSSLQGLSWCGVVMAEPWEPWSHRLTGKCLGSRRREQTSGSDRAKMVASWTGPVNLLIVVRPTRQRGKPAHRPFPEVFWLRNNLGLDPVPEPAYSPSFGARGRLDVRQELAAPLFLRRLLRAVEHATVLPYSVTSTLI